MQLAQLGQGSGMVGLPGDFTPPSRFVRAFAYSKAAPQATTEIENVKQAFHILNNFDIPKGSTVDKDGHSESTQWTSAIDLHNKIFYFRPYENFQLQKIELMNMNLNAEQPIILPMHRTEDVVDVTTAPEII